jgi:phenylacetate-CoA ligase
VNDRDNHGLAIPRVFSSAETLTDNARRLISGSFGCDLRNFYGSTEAAWIAWECEKGGMHLHDSVIAEIVDSKGRPVPRGGSGSLVLTPTWKRAMPFIRYDTGDIASLGPSCRCGRGTPVLGSLEGRSDDFIVMPSGMVRSARFVDLSIRDLPGILLYQAYQPEAGSLEFRIVPSGKFTNDSRERLLKRLKASFPEPMEITIEVVDRIARGKSGKIRSVISKVKSPLPGPY